MFKSRLCNMLSAALVAMSVAGTNALAAEPSSMDEPRDLGAPLCKDVMRMSGQEREIAIALAHGYVLGKKGTTQYVIRTLAQITDEFMDYCLDHPTANALQTFEKVAR